MYCLPYCNQDSLWCGVKPEFEECDQENIQDWLKFDVDDPVYQVLEDDEIIASVIDDQDTCDDEEEPSDNDCAEKGTTPARKLFTALRRLWSG
ncbi:hypothetical protein AVEN_123806-1 [Araneus ventricosus]|uniref:Uncharacterized protein n=1 Tax=Araneus ventricosus TaxID=182803 RepID=A0A4Y2BN04_ARAVE|nr:hypothetical protein AVEN_123806-1 [Araneus ventricosus]